MNPDAYCRQKAAPGGSSLYYAFLFLPPARRQAITALYALRREAEEIAADCPDAQLAQAKLAWWRLEVGRLFEGNPSHPVTRALRPFLGTYRISAALLNEAIGAMEADLAQSRYLDFAGLERHCDRFAGSLGAIAAGILGYRDPRTLEYGRRLGTALELAGVICEVGAHARRNRIYLPMDELKRFGVPAADILQARYSDGFVELMKFQSARANDLCGQALDALPREDRRAQRAGLIMAALCRATLAEIERDGFRVLTQRTSLTPLRRFWLAWKTWVSN